jgi:hypothetical protein
VNELIRGFRPQGRIRRGHRKDVKVDVEIKRGRLRPPVRAVSKSSVRRGDTIRTHATMSGHCVNGWVPVGNILMVLTRTGALNLIAAR